MQDFEEAVPTLRQKMAEAYPVVIVPCDGWDTTERPSPIEDPDKNYISPGRYAIPAGHIALKGDFETKHTDIPNY